MASEPEAAPGAALAGLSRDELLKLLEVYALSWLAHDGCWFLAAEERLGHAAAVELDTHAWACFAPAEARRLAQALGLGQAGGLEALETALRYRMYAAINRHAAERVDAHTLRWRMVSCRVQETRQRKGLPPFACQPVGLVEYTHFARAIDPRIQTRCVHAPPDAATNGFCEWEFSL